jgi:hypothetical protein
VSIIEIPTRELVEDLVASLQDITLCEFCLAQGVQTYGTEKSVAYRLEANRQMAAQIKAELERRGETVNVPA